MGLFSLVSLVNRLYVLVMEQLRGYGATANCVLVIALFLVSRSELDESATDLSNVGVQRGHSVDRRESNYFATAVRSGKLVIGHYNRQRESSAKSASVNVSLQAVNFFNGSEDTNYQSDWVYGEGALPPWMAKLQFLKPSVICRDDAMMLRLWGIGVSQLLIDGGGAGLVPLSQLLGWCGFSVRRVWQDIILTVPYDGCHVRQKGGHHILQLWLWGQLLKLSCPVVSRPPKVTCGFYHMVVKLEGAAAEGVRVMAKGSWVPLLASRKLCHYRVSFGPDYVLITIPYTTPCVAPEDTNPTLRLFSADGEMTLRCSSWSGSPTNHPPLAVDPHNPRDGWPYPLPTTTMYAQYHNFPLLQKPHGQNTFGWLGALPTSTTQTTPPPYYPIFNPYQQGPFHLSGYPKIPRRSEPNPRLRTNLNLYQAWHSKVPAKSWHVP